MQNRFNKAVGNSITVAAKIVNVNARQFRFDENKSELNLKRITGFRVHTDAPGKTFEGTTLAANAIIKKAYLSLVDNKDVHRLKRVPLETFFNNNGVTDDVPIDMVVDIDKSYIDLPDATGAVANTAFMITFWYDN